MQVDLNTLNYTKNRGVVMKKLLFFLVLFFVSLTATSDVNKFKVTFTITINECTLEQATKIEKELLKDYDNVAVSIEQELSGIVTFSDHVVIPDYNLKMEIKDVMPNYTYPSWVIDPEMLKSIGKNSEVEKP